MLLIQERGAAVLPELPRVSRVLDPRVPCAGERGGHQGLWEASKARLPTGTQAIILYACGQRENCSYQFHTDTVHDIMWAGNIFSYKR